MAKRFSNVIPESYLTEMREVLLSPDFQWHLVPYTVPPHTLASELDTIHEGPMLFHSCMIGGNYTSDVGPLFKPLLWFLEKDHGVVAKRIERIKINMVLKDGSYPPNCHHSPHVDVWDTTGDYNTFLFYVNSADGDTVILEDDKIVERHSPQGNSGILFDSKLFHASSPPVTSQYRLVVNYIFEV